MTDFAAATRSPFPRRFTRVTVAGVLMIAGWAVIGVAIIYALAMSVDADQFARYGRRILSGVIVSVKLVAFAIVAGAILSVPVAAGRMSRSRIVGGLAYGYSYFFRGTPLIAQLFLIYYGAGQFAPQLKAAGLWWAFSDAFACAVLAFALNTAAYQAEILAGAIRHVDRGQWEAAASLGLRRYDVLRSVIAPQAVIIALRPYGNEVILLLKASAVASVVTVLDLMGQTRFVFSRTYDISIYFWAAVLYLALVELIGRGVNAAERRATRHLAGAGN